MKRVAVIGGGIFGATTAIHAARAGYEVHLFEEQPGLLQAASGINQYRLHRGYHYPRSVETARSASAAERSFREEYGAAVIDEGRHLYAIAREGSRVSGAAYLAFCDANRLPYRVVEAPGLVRPELVELVVEVPEARFDPERLRALVADKLAAEGVTVRLATRADSAAVGAFDTVIVAAYSGNNAILRELGGPTETHQFEVCEKPVISLPAWFGLTDIVVMDGPFMSLDPLGQSGRYVMGHVVHAIHHSNNGIAPEIPDALRPCLNKGIVQNPPHTRFTQFIEAGARFIPALAQARHLGSMYTVRVVLPDRDDTDERPSIVTRVNERVIQIFSGKIGNCVESARKAVALI
jgi:glycine/D-amino acid oxidase-like deaminating enzyme